MRTVCNTFMFLLFLLPLTYLKAQNSIPENKLEKISLKINLEPNTNYRFISKTLQNINQEMMGNEIEIKQDITISYKFEVENNSAEGIKVKVYYERIEIDLDMPQAKLTMDSNNESNDEVFAKLSNVINKPFYIYFMEDGKISKMEGLKEIFENLDFQGNPLIQGLFNEKNLISSMESSFNIFPPTAVNMGETWSKSHDLKVNNQFDMLFERNFTLESLSEDLAWINVEGKITGSLSDTSASASYKASLNGTQEGTIEVDRNSGLIFFSDTKQEVNMIMTTLGLEVPVKMTTTSTLKGEKL